jgi:L-arabinokinase
MDPSYRIVFYISGHGFGHASRMLAVIEGLLSASSRVHVSVRTSAPPRLFGHEGTDLRASRYDGQAKKRSGVSGVKVVELECDAGVVQRDSLEIDVAESIRRANAFQTALPSLVSAEAAFLREHRANLVVGDIPPLAFGAAAAAGVPSVAIGNFTWDWIYEGYPHTDTRRLAEDIRRIYAEMTLALRLPMWGGFAGLETKTRDIPFIAHQSCREPDEVRTRMGLATAARGGPLVLLAFGGHGIRLDAHALDALRGYTVVTTVSEQQLRVAELRYQDLVRAADVVVTKPGFSVISEAIANDAALLYTSRGQFREYDVLVREMPRYVRARFIEPDDLIRGNWSNGLEALLAQPDPPEKPALNGAQVAVEEILRMARSG